jgi:dimethylargininase
MLKNEGDRLRRVIVCTPRTEYFNVSDLKAQNINEVADRDATIRQHDTLKSTMESFDCEVVDAPELTGHPNSVFTRDASLVTPRGYIKLRMGLAARRGEETWMADVLESLDIPCAGEIAPPGTVEGGDVILAGSVAFVGKSRRTNEEGIRQLSALLADMGYEVRIAPVRSGSLHIGGVMSAIGPERIVCCREDFPEEFFRGFDAVDVPWDGPSSGNVICLAEDEVIANSAENMITIRILEANGVNVHAVDLSEFRKGAGGPTCLILPVDRD